MNPVGYDPPVSFAWSAERFSDPGRMVDARHNQYLDHFRLGGDRPANPWQIWDCGRVVGHTSPTRFAPKSVMSGLTVIRPESTIWQFDDNQSMSLPFGVKLLGVEANLPLLKRLEGRYSHKNEYWKSNASWSPESLGPFPALGTHPDLIEWLWDHISCARRRLGCDAAWRTSQNEGRRLPPAKQPWRRLRCQGRIYRRLPENSDDDTNWLLPKSTCGTACCARSPPHTDRSCAFPPTLRASHQRSPAFRTRDASRCASLRLPKSPSSAADRTHWR